ncbi:hypothetical protein M758_UG047300, partial [Ceratodon purpureus]
GLSKSPLRALQGGSFLHRQPRVLDDPCPWFSSAALPFPPNLPPPPSEAPLPPRPRTCSHPKAANMRASVPLGCMWRVLIPTPSLAPLPGLPTTKLIFPVIPIHSHNTLRAASGLPSPINKYLNEPTQDNCLLELHFLRSVTCRQCLQSPVIINFAHNLQSFSKFRFHYLSED